MKLSPSYVGTCKNDLHKGEGALRICFTDVDPSSLKGNIDIAPPLCGSAEFKGVCADGCIRLVSGGIKDRLPIIWNGKFDGEEINGTYAAYDERLFSLLAGGGGLQGGTWRCNPKGDWSQRGSDLQVRVNIDRKSNPPGSVVTNSVLVDGKLKAVRWTVPNNAVVSQKIRLNGEGGSGRGGADAGDLILVIEHIVGPMDPQPRPLPELVKADATLAVIVGSTPIPRGEVTKKLWDYITKNKLQDEKRKTNINADEALAAVFGGRKQVTMSEMTKLISQHLDIAYTAPSPAEFRNIETITTPRTAWCSHCQCQVVPKNDVAGAVAKGVLGTLGGIFLANPIMAVPTIRGVFNSLKMKCPKCGNKL